MGMCNSARIISGSGSSIHSEVNRETSSKILSSTLSSTNQIEDEILQSPNLKVFTFLELQAATRNFSRDSLLGEGYFGFVFKAFIDEHSLKATTNPKTGMGIAVKMLDPKGNQGQQEWLAEIKYLGQLRHPNLVKLIGYCVEDDNRILVYQFMPKGSLENHLFRRVSHNQLLCWDLRMKVALGAAKGLAFLHNEAQVIHRDFNTSNVLLDSNYNAKISDFGLAKDGPVNDKSHVSSRIMGTSAYVAPDYKNTGHLTTKADVYSFGVVLVELISGRPASSQDRPDMEQSLVDWAVPLLSNKRKTFKVVDSRLEGKFAFNGVLEAANLAVQCLSTEPGARPNMEEVVKVLEQIITSDRC